MIEHALIGELQKRLWCLGIRDFEVLHSEVDNAGYDIVIEANGFIRHIQIKASTTAGKTNRQNINLALARKPSGCVVWAQFEADTLDFCSFLWFGGEPGQRLPCLGDKVTKHTKANSEGIKAERSRLRVLNKGSFEKVADIAALTERLFGV